MASFSAHSTWILVFGSFVIFSIIILGIYHYKLTQDLPPLDSSKKRQAWSKLVKIFTFIALFFYFLQTISIAIQPFELARSHSACDLWEFFATLFYHYSKIMLYSLFISRLQVAFIESIYEYNKKLIIYPMYSVLFIYMIIVSIADYTDVNSYWNNITESCDPEWALWGLLLTLSIDFIFSIITLILFIRPLCHLKRYATNINQSAEAFTFEFIIRKYSCLVTISVISSVIMIIIAAIVDTSDIAQSTLLQTIIMNDNFVNVICMLLMSRVHNRSFIKLCGIFIPLKMKQDEGFNQQINNSSGRATSEAQQVADDETIITSVNHNNTVAQ